MSFDQTISPLSANELEAIAMRYIEGLLSADDSNVPLSPDVKRAHLIVFPGRPVWWRLAQGADIIRADIRREKLTVRKNLRATVDRERSTVIVLWESGMDSEYARAITIMDRFVITGGLISEIEIISIPQGQDFMKEPYPGLDAVLKDAGH
jgi:hypothetical protein